MRSATKLQATLLAVVVLAGSPALPITNGAPDGARHPNVGFIAFIYTGSDDLSLFCSGTLIGPRVFLSASHCTAFLEDGLANGYIDKVYVGFDEEFSSDLGRLRRTFEVDRVVTNPAYTLGHLADDGDLAVLVLGESVSARFPDIQPARLPTAGLLDEMQARGGLLGQPFTAVGYGDTTALKGGGPPQTVGDGSRRVAVSDYRGLAPGYIHLSSNPSTGDGGVCYGDSGGPNFLGDSDVIAAETSWGATWCRATNNAYRLDTETARSFLASYVTLP